MALRSVGTTPDSALLSLPWFRPLEEWDDDLVLPLPRGLSRHVVRIVRVGSEVYALKETNEQIAIREHEMLGRLRRLELPAVKSAGVVTGRETEGGEPLPAVLLTRYLRYSMPYRSLFSDELSTEGTRKLIDAMVVLLVKLHLAGFFWGDMSLSNVLFRRSAGEYAAYLVDAETGELHEQLSDGQRNHDLEVGHTNIYGDLLDLQAGGLIDPDVDALEVVDLIVERYRALWDELTAAEEFSVEEIWRLDERVNRLNELGFEVEELDVVSTNAGSSVRIQPRVVEADHHRRELMSLTGLDVEENQARRLLNELASYIAYYDLGFEDRTTVASRWMMMVFQPVANMVPPHLRGKLEAAEVFHEVLLNRWYMAQRAGHEIDTFDAAQDYIDNVLSRRADEAVAAPSVTTSTSPTRA